jgi:hypothetical protein
MDARADAEVDEVPGQAAPTMKSVTTVALQLLKRFRNIVYAASTGRIPPSVMMSCFAGHTAQPGLSLSDMVIRQARLIVRELRQAGLRREKVMVINPVFSARLFHRSLAGEPVAARGVRGQARGPRRRSRKH